MKINKEKSIFNRNNWFGYCSLILTILIAFLWQFNTPRHSDDFIFQHEIVSNSLVENISHKIETPTQAFKSIKEQYINNDGRLSNAFYITAQLLPLPVIKALCGLFLALFASLFWIWSGKTSLKNDWLSLAIPLLFWTGLQWNDQMQSSDFQFNYTISSIMLISCLLLFRGEKKVKIGGWILLIIFACWHECFTIALGIIFGVQWLYTRKSRYLIAIIILIGGFLLQFSSGSQNRFFYSIKNFNLEFYHWSYLISKSWVSIVAIIWWLFRRKKLETTQKKEIDIFASGLLAAWGAILVIILLLRSPQRAHWPEDVLAICLILKLILSYSNSKFKNKNWLKILLLTLYATWGGHLVYWQVRVKKFTNLCVESIAKNNFVITDTTNVINENIPFWLMDMTRIQYNTYAAYELMAMPACLTSERNYSYVVLPPELKNTEFDDWPDVPGNNDFKLPSGNVLVRKQDGKLENDEVIKITFGQPSISTTPLDAALSFFRYGTFDTVELNIIPSSKAKFEIGNDTLEVFALYSAPPRTILGRKIIRVDVSS